MTNGKVESRLDTLVSVLEHATDAPFAFLSSLKLAVTLIILIAIFSIVGTVIIQSPIAEPGAIERTYMPATVKLFNYLGFFNAYHSLWFSSLLLLLGLNLIFCTIDLLPRHLPYLKTPNANPSEYFIKSQSLQGMFETSLLEDQLKEKVTQGFKKKRLSTAVTESSDRTVIFGQQGLWWRFTVYGIHASLLVILTGGWIGSRLGYDGFLRLIEGTKTNEFFIGKTVDSLRPYPLGFELKCDRARFLFREDLPGFSFDPLNAEQVKSVSLVKSWFSDMTIAENAHGTFARTIKVNDPLIHKGLKIYQASFGITADFKKLVIAYKMKDAPDSNANLVAVANGALVKAPGADFSIRIKQFIPDLRISQQTKRPASGSNEFFDPPYDNPAAQLEVIRDDGKRYDPWAFLNYPWLDKRETLPYSFNIQTVEPKYYTGLSVNHAPEIPVVYTGFGMLAVSLIARFYFSHKRYWVQIKRNGTYCTVLIAGHTSRHVSSFENRFNSFLTGLKAETHV